MSRLPGPFEIHRIVETERELQPVDFVLKGVTAEAFAATDSGQDPRFAETDGGRLVLCFQSFLIRTGTANILVDTCVGNDKERLFLEQWHHLQTPYLNRLAAAGVSPEDIDFVCCTHLHADHVGWNTRLEDGRWVPTFPNARYLFARREVDYWGSLDMNDPENLYRIPWQDSVNPVLEAGLADLVENDHEIESGIQIVPAPGHTPGNVVIQLNDGRRAALMSGDVMHHPVQIERPHWASEFCVDPDHANVTRRELLERIVDSGTVLLAAHFPAPTAMHVISRGDGFFYADV